MHATSSIKGIRQRILVLLVLLSGLALTPGAGSAVGAAQRDSASPRPTIVLVHGAWADASSWNLVAERLQQEGFPVLAPANPLRGVASDSAYLQSILETVTGPVVLVGHSYGGMTITNAALGNANVKALVYIAAFAPDQGDSLGSLEAINPGSQIGPSTLVFRPWAGGTDAYVNPKDFRNAVAADLPRSTTAVMAATQRPLEASVFTEGSGTPAWKAIPSWFLVASRDNAIPAATERFMAERAGSKTVEVRSSHLAMISHPDIVTNLIRRASR